MLLLLVMSFILQVLSVLVRVVTESIADAGGVPSSHLQPKLLELFGHITAKVTNNSDVWRLYAELLSTSDSLTDTLHERVSGNYMSTEIFVIFCCFLRRLAHKFHFCWLSHFSMLAASDVNKTKISQIKLTELETKGDGFRP